MVRNDIDSYKSDQIVSNTNLERAPSCEIVYNKIIHLINQKRLHMLGPEKTKTAKFISENFMDVFLLLKELIEE